MARMAPYPALKDDRTTCGGFCPGTTPALASSAWKLSGGGDGGGVDPGSSPSLNAENGRVLVDFGNGLLGQPRLAVEVKEDEGGRFGRMEA
jgi:hypothetical protein